MLRRVILSLPCVLLLTASASAQLASQTALVGTVTDADGLGVPGAQVVAVNAGTRDTYEAATNSDGYYNIHFVRTGTYEITVTLSGFQTSKVSGVEVANNQVVRTNVVVKVGQLNESITVVAAAPVLDTDSARISETIGQRAVSDLPLNGRNVWSLASTTPGVVAAPTSDIGLSFRGAGHPEECAAPQPVRGADGRSRDDPQALRRPQQDLLHGRVRRDSRERADRRLHLGSDDADAPGELFRNQHRHQEPRHGPAVSRQHHSQVGAVPCRAEASRVLPGDEPAGDNVQRADQRCHGRQHRPGPHTRRPEHRQQDKAVLPQIGR